MGVRPPSAPLTARRGQQPVGGLGSYGLRAHDDVAAAYGALKLELVGAHAADREAYCEGKDPFIKEHEVRALAWARRG